MERSFFHQTVGAVCSRLKYYNASTMSLMQCPLASFTSDSAGMDLLALTHYPEVASEIPLTLDPEDHHLPAIFMWTTMRDGC